MNKYEFNTKQDVQQATDTQIAEAWFDWHMQFVEFSLEVIEELIIQRKLTRFNIKKYNCERNII